MRNPDLPKLLRARGSVMQSEGLQIIYEQSAIELEKLEKIYELIDNTSVAECAMNPGMIVSKVIGILYNDT